MLITSYHKTGVFSRTLDRMDKLYCHFQSYIDIFTIIHMMLGFTLPQFLIQTAPGQLALSSVERLDPHVWANPERDGIVPMGDCIDKGSMCTQVLCFGKSELYSKLYFTVVTPGYHRHHGPRL